MDSVFSVLQRRDRPTIVDGVNFSPIIQIITWLVLGMSIMSVFTKVLTKRAISKKLAYDDLLICAALIFSVAQSVTLLAPAGQAFGQTISTLTAKQVQDALKAQLAGLILYLYSLSLTKLSLLVFLDTITPIKFHKILIIGTAGSIALWAISGTFALAFQCPAPRTWDYVNQSCSGRLAILNYVNILNAVTDMALIILPTIIVMPLNMSRLRRATVVGVFLLRFLVVAVIIVQVIYLNQETNTKDVTFDPWPAILCTETVQSISIILACIPFLKPFLASLQSGYLRADDNKRRTTVSTYLSNDKSGTNKSTNSNKRYVEIADQRSESAIKLQDVQSMHSVQADSNTDNEMGIAV